MRGNIHPLGLFKLYANDLCLGVADAHIIEGAPSSVTANVDLDNKEVSEALKEAYFKGELFDMQLITDDSKVEGLFFISELTCSDMVIESAGQTAYTQLKESE